VTASSRSGRNTLIFTLVAFGVVVLDQALKAAVAGLMEQGRAVAVIPHLLWLTYTTNTGAAFGLLRGSGQVVFLTALIIVVLLLAWFFWSRGSMGAWAFAGLGLIIGGAVGNLVDRLFRGSVVDFIDFSWWPVFNIADMAIVAGVIIILLVYARELWRAEGEVMS
jgi:signal peptidase II